MTLPAMDEKMLERYPRFSWGDIKKRLAEKAPFEAISPMGTSLIRVKNYEPLIGLAVHAGHRVREELIPKMAIEEDERAYEEDLFVEHFIVDFPIQMIGLDSRYEYDVNRPKEQAVYLKPFQSWGKKVWQNPPTKDELQISHQKYDEFHELMDFLIGEIGGPQRKAVVFDVHSYNSKRPQQPDRNAQFPLFILGTAALDRKKHGKSIEFVLSDLDKIQLPGFTVTVKENEIFKGDGAIAKTIVKNYPDSFVINLEVKKMYMDELTGKGDEKMIRLLANEIHKLGQKTLDQFLCS